MMMEQMKQLSGMATLLANPAKRIERGAPHLIRFEEQRNGLPTASPAEVLRFLLERHGLRQCDLAPDLGGESVVSEVLSGKRKLNAAHIEQLSARFHVSPAVFFASAPSARL